MDWSISASTNLFFGTAKICWVLGFPEALHSTLSVWLEPSGTKCANSEKRCHKCPTVPFYFRRLFRLAIRGDWWSTCFWTQPVTTSDFSWTETALIIQKRFLWVQLLPLNALRHWKPHMMHLERKDMIVWITILSLKGKFYILRNLSSSIKYQLLCSQINAKLTSYLITKTQSLHLLSAVV